MNSLKGYCCQTCPGCTQTCVIQYLTKAAQAPITHAPVTDAELPCTNIAPPTAWYVKFAGGGRCLVHCRTQRLPRLDALALFVFV